MTETSTTRPLARSWSAGPGLVRLAAAAGSRRALGMAMVAAMTALMLPPVVILVRNSLTESRPDGSRGAYTIANYTRILTQPDLYTSAWNTLQFASLSTVMVLIFGAVLAWLVERTNAPFKGLVYLATIVSLGTPFILYAAAWIYVLGPAGPVNDLYRTLTGSGGLLFDVHTIWGMSLIEAFVWMSLVFLMFSASFRAANADMEEAARMSGASVFAMFRRVSLPLVWPALAAVSMFVFINTLQAFDVPVLVGVPSNISVLSSDIYFSIREVPPKLDHASAFSVILIVVIAGLMVWYTRLSRNADRYASVTGKGFRPPPIDLGRLRWLGGAVIVIDFLIVLVMPFSALLWIASTPFLAPMRWANLKLMTMKNFDVVIEEGAHLQAAVNTITIAAAAASIAVALTIVVGWLSARRGPGSAVLDQLCTIPMLFPGIVMGWR